MALVTLYSPHMHIGRLSACGKAWGTGNERIQIGGLFLAVKIISNQIITTIMKGPSCLFK